MHTVTTKFILNIFSYNQLNHILDPEGKMKKTGHNKLFFSGSLSQITYTETKISLYSSLHLCKSRTTYCEQLYRMIHPVKQL